MDVNETATPSPRLAASQPDLAVFRQIYAPARRFAAFVAIGEMEPDDLVQEALSRVLGRGPLNELDDPLAYMRKTMLNLVRNEVRRRGREQRALSRVQSLAELASPADESCDTQLLAAALQILPAQTRAAVFLVDVEGLPIRDASALVGLSATATRARLSRARRTLRDHIAQQGEDHT